MTGQRTPENEPVEDSPKYDNKRRTYRFGRFSAWPLGLSAFLIINAAAFARGAPIRLAVCAAAVPFFLAWLRLRVRLDANELTIRNLVRTSRFDLTDTNTKIWVDNGGLWASNPAGTTRAWGADGHPKSRNESAVEKLEDLCFALLQRTFRRGGASFKFD